MLKSTGITATAGIGTNLYLSKIAMDIVAKHLEPDENGVRIAELDELGYKMQLWDHRPLTDFWRLGPGYARKLESAGMHTMGDIALRSEFDEEWFFRTFGVNAGCCWTTPGGGPCTIADIKAYRPSTNSLSSGQVLQCPYYFNEKARLIVWEMTERLALDLLESGWPGTRWCWT